MNMAMNPEILKKAQDEIDTVTGLSRLPGFEDRSALPYCEAVYREVMRIRPVAPLGVPHAASEDDIYEGYFIPKGWFPVSSCLSYSQISYYLRHHRPQ